MKYIFRKSVGLMIIIFIFIIPVKTLFADGEVPDTIDSQDKKYHEIIDKGKRAESKGHFEEALEKYYISLSIERYEACSYYAMFDIAKVYLKIGQYPQAIYFLKNYISKVEDELVPGSPCSAYTSESIQEELLKSKEEASILLKNAINAFCKEVDDDFVCSKIK